MHRGRRLLGLGADAVRDEPDGPAERLGEGRRHGRQRILRVGLALGLPEMRRADDPRPAVEDRPDGRQRLDDPRGVENLAARQRDVEVDAQEDRLPLEGQLGEGFHGGHLIKPAA